MGIKLKKVSKSLLAVFTIIILSITSIFFSGLVVNAANVSSIGVGIPVHNLTLIVGGDTGKLKATVMPANAVNKAVTWSSSSETVATVSSTGVVTPLSEGVAIITVKTVDGGYTDFCIVTVVEKAVTGITLDTNQVTIKVGGTLTLKPTISPIDASNKDVIWSSSNEAVARISSTGVVTGVSQGSVGIMGRTVDGDFRCYSIIYVVQPITSITLSQTSMKFNVGDAGIDLTAKVNPANVSIKDVIWSSSNPFVAYMNSEGKVVPVSGGTATITATSVQDKTKKATCSVTVTGANNGSLTNPVTNVTMSSKQENLIIGQKLTLKAAITPTNASNKTITWSSSNEAIATVSSTGVVTPVSEGITVIIAKSSNGPADTCIVTVVKQAVTGISLDTNQATIKVGGTLTLKPTISPTLASNKDIIWSSSNEAVARISSTGVVTGVAQGSVGIMGRTVDGDFRCYSIIYVVQPITSITLSQTSMKFDVGDAGIALTAKVNPDNVSIKDVKWSSSNPFVAYMNSEGRVVPVSGGTATITATSVMDNTKKATCSVTVTGTNNGSVTNPVTNVSMSSKQETLIIGQKLTLKAVITPANAANKTITWSSSNEAVATVSSAGVVTPVSEGITVIIAKSANGPADSCIVTVVKEAVTGISLDTDQATIKVGGTLTLKPTISPIDASNKDVIWSSSNEAVARISSTGVVTGVSQGSVGIMGRTVDGDFRCYSIIYVVQPITSITLSQTSMKFDVGDAGIALTATVNPANVSIKDVIWSSSNPLVAYMNSEGKVVPVSGGTATITATSVQDNTKKATCSVTVTGANNGSLTNPVTNVSMSSRQENLIIGQKLTLKATVTPANAANKTITWSSSNEAVATVSSAGVVTPVSEGIAVIIAKSANGPADACIVTVVKQAVTGISLDTDQATIKVGGTLTLKPTISPTNASNKDIIWSSSNEAVARISSTGVVTGVAQGSVGIMGRTVDGDFRCYSIIYVVQPISSITLSQTSMKFDVGDAGIALTATVNPGNVSIKDIIWSSSNPLVAYMNSEGKVVPVSGGTATITATSVMDNTKKATCSVTVTTHATGVEITN